MSWLTDILTGNSGPQAGYSGAASSAPMQIDSAGVPFPYESCWKVYSYDMSTPPRKLTERVTEPGTNKIRVRSFSYNPDGTLASESMWTPS